MKCSKKMICGLLFTTCFLLLCACAGTVEKHSKSSQNAETAANREKLGVTVMASFYREGGGNLSGVQVCVSIGEDSATYPLNGDEELRLPGFPREGEAELSLLDEGEQRLGGMGLRFTTGAVVDASTDGDGVGHIMLKESTEELALAFTLAEDGSVCCSLRLTQPTEA